MSSPVLCRSTSGRLLGGWAPLLCVVLGSLLAFLMPLVGVDHRFYGALRGIAQLHCPWGRSQQPPAVQSTSLTVPFPDLGLLPFKSKPSKGTDKPTTHNVLNAQIHLPWWCFCNSDLSGPRSDSHIRLHV